MKKILTAAAALLLTVSTFAKSGDSPPPAGGGMPPQGQGQRPPQTPEQRAKRATDQINSIQPLGDAYAKVLAVNTQAEAKRESIMGHAKRSELTDDQKAQLKALRESSKADLKNAMGPDLYAKYEAAEKARRDARRGGQGGPGMQGPPQGGGNGN